MIDSQSAGCRKHALSLLLNCPALRAVFVVFFCFCARLQSSSCAPSVVGGLLDSHRPRSIQHDVVRPRQRMHTASVAINIDQSICRLDFWLSSSSSKIARWLSRCSCGRTEGHILLSCSTPFLAISTAKTTLKTSSTTSTTYGFHVAGNRW